MSEENKSYSASDIKVLEGLEAVRKRPAMYIGTTDINGLHHLINEVVDNSIDEALAGYCTNISVVLKEEGSVSVIDDGRGIPVDIQQQYQISALELIMTKLHAGGKFEKDAYKISGGLHGVGVSCVNALSEWLDVEVYRDGKKYFQRYERGIPVDRVKEIGETDLRGTKVTFYPDTEIFKEGIEFHYDRVAERLRELAFLNPGIKIFFKEERTEKSEEYFYRGGIEEFVNFIDSSKKHIHTDIIRVKKEDGEAPVDIAFRFNTEYSDIFFSYVNNIRTRDGGSHVVGFRTALTSVINKFIKERNMLKKDQQKLQITGDDVKEGLVAIVSVYIAEPQFEGQTKNRLGNSEVKGAVQSAVFDKLSLYFDDNPTVGEAICKKIIFNAEAREAARKAKQVKRKGYLEGSSLPGKLTDCITKERDLAELFIVEGDSAGGNAKQGRDRFYQAILPLKGKILNVEKANPHKVLTNEEIRNLITAIGTGFDDNFDFSKLRYGKIIIMTDADVDGSHITILLLTFFYRYFKELIEKGNIYIAMPPLYKVVTGKTKTFVFTDKERDELIKKCNDEGKKISGIQRFKGLGEMDMTELWETTMDKGTRILQRVALEDAIIAERIFSILMGESVVDRKDFIEKNAVYAKNIDV